VGQPVPRERNDVSWASEHEDGWPKCETLGAVELTEPEWREQYGRESTQPRAEMVEEKKKSSSPPYQVFSLPTQMHIIRDDKIMRPIDDLLVGLVRRLRTEWRIPHQTLKRDSPQRPPIALAPIPLLQENLWRDIIWSPNCGICLCGETTEAARPDKQSAKKKKSSQGPG